VLHEIESVLAEVAVFGEIDGERGSRSRRARRLVGAAMQHASKIRQKPVEAIFH
jgi:hypothetical protein